MVAINFLRRIEQLESFVSTGTEALSSPLLQWQALGKQKFAQSPVPQRQQELWRYSNLTEFFQRDWHFQALDFAFVLKKQITSSGIQVRAVQELSPAQILQLRTQFPETSAQQFFYHLNTACLPQAVVIDVDDETSVAQPIILDYLGAALSATTENPAINTRIFLRLGKKSQLQVIEKTHAEGSSFQNSVLSVLQAEDSHLKHVHWQKNTGDNYAFSQNEFFLQSGAQLATTVLTLGGRYGRSTVNVYHQGQQSSSQVNGLYLLGADNHADHYTNIEHQVGHCTTTQLYKGILSGPSRAVFNGRICIFKDAQKASTQQLNKNLLLSAQAEVDAKPQLEILADDVKATHGATVGQLNEEEVFYLQSRGLSRSTALQLLSAGFALDVLEQSPLAAQFGKDVQQYLQELSLQ